MRFKFKAKYLPMLARFAGVKDIRYYLNGFHVEAAEIGGVYLVATNGHAMLAIHDADGFISERKEPARTIRMSAGLVAAARMATRGSLPQFVLLDGKRLSIAPDFDMEHTCLERFIQSGEPLIEGDFPAWRKVLPDFSELVPGALTDGCDMNLDLLAKFKLESGAKYGAMISLWRSPGDGSAVVVQFLGVPEAVGVVMPARASNDKATQLRNIQARMPAKTA